MDVKQNGPTFFILFLNGLFWGRAEKGSAALGSPMGRRFVVGTGRHHPRLPEVVRAKGKGFLSQTAVQAFWFWMAKEEDIVVGAPG